MTWMSLIKGTCAIKYKSAVVMTACKCQTVGFPSCPHLTLSGHNFHGKSMASVWPGLMFSPLSPLGQHQQFYRPKLRSLIVWSIELWRINKLLQKKSCAQNRSHRHTEHTLYDTVRIRQPPPTCGLSVNGINLCQGSHSLCLYGSHQFQQLELSSLCARVCHFLF